ncbi:MAG: epoxyqueuosine reductase [Candidatus Eisenbacteria bacterium]|nr:epoxyqueuosine reductase [Candidatus Eisenbacteria bacterium]
MADAGEIREVILNTVDALVLNWGGATQWRKPLVGFASAQDSRFTRLASRPGSPHALPQDFLAHAGSVVSFFLPFDEGIVASNVGGGAGVSREWATAYVETNALISRIGEHVAERLHGIGIEAVAQPAVGDFDEESLACIWSHKSVAVIAGLGTRGVHNMVITDSGCAGRFGSMVLDVDIATDPAIQRERCKHNATGTCLACVELCPVGALKPDGSFDRRLCWAQCREAAKAFTAVGIAPVCGKCATGPCAMGPGA